MKKSVVLLLLLCVVKLALSQAFSQKELDKAKALEEKRKYGEAIQIYTKLANSPSLPPEKVYEVFMGLGNCYLNINNYEKALENYYQLLEREIESKELYYQIGRAQLGLCKYDESVKSFQKLLRITDDPYPSSNLNIDNEAIRRIELTQKASQEKKNEDIIIRNLTPINTTFSEYSVYFHGNSLYFSSMRLKPQGGRVDQRTVQGFSKIYATEYTKSSSAIASSTTNVANQDVMQSVQWSEPKIVPGALNSRVFNNGLISIDTVRKIAYTTRCNGEEGRCRIYEIILNDDYRPVRAMLSKINVEGFSFGHPAVTGDGNTLYFVSDMQGGQGGLDLWKVTKNPEGNWDMPVNLGPTINTSYDEMFPSLFRDSILIFASNGHNTYGSLDLFYSTIESTGYGQPINFGIPINSGSDDFSLAFSKDLNAWFFCSNRPGGVGNDDIYYFDNNQVSVRAIGEIKDSISGEPIVGAMVIVKSSDGKVDTLFTDREGKYDTRLNPNKSYEIEVWKEGFVQQKRKIDAQPDRGDAIYLFDNKKNPYDVSFSLKPDKVLISLEGTVKDGGTGQNLKGIEVVVVDKNGNTYVTRTDAQGRYQFNNLTDNQTYSVTVNSEGYYSKTIKFDVPKLSFDTPPEKKKYRFDLVADKIEVGKEVVLYDIHFEYNKWDLLPESKKEIDKIVDILKNNPQYNVEIAAHTDERGSDKYNDELSLKRAQSVVNYLTQKGIAKSRLIAQGYGETRPLVRNATTEEEHLINRRTSFKILRPGDGKAELVLASHTNIIYKVQVAERETPTDIQKSFAYIKRIMPEINIYQEKNLSGRYSYYAGAFVNIENAINLRNRLRAIGCNECVVSINKNKNK